MIQGRVDRRRGEGRRGGGNVEGETRMGRRERLRWGDGEGGNGGEEGEGGEEMARARSGKQRGRREGGQEGVGWGGGDRIGTMGRRLGGGQWGGEDGEGNLKGEMGREATGRGRRIGKRRRHFTDGYDLMSGWTYSLGRLWCSPLATSTCNA